MAKGTKVKRVRYQIPIGKDNAKPLLCYHRKNSDLVHRKSKDISHE